MREKKILYGYVWEHWDNTMFTVGLWNATRNFIEEHSIQPTFFQQWPEPKIFYNNFEISNMDIWNNRGYREYIDYIDKLGGIYYHRWGDAPIKGLAMSLFVPRDKLHRFDDLGYLHIMENLPKNKDNSNSNDANNNNERTMHWYSRCWYRLQVLFHTSLLFISPPSAARNARSSLSNACVLILVMTFCDVNYLKLP